MTKSFDKARLARLAIFITCGTVILTCIACSSPPATHRRNSQIDSAARTPSAALGATDDVGEPVTPITAADVERREWQFRQSAGVLLTTPHFDLYTTMRRRSVLDQMPLFLEHALAHYTQTLTPLPAPGRRLETYLFATRADWEAKTKELLPNRAGTYLSLGRGGFTTRGRSVLYYIGRTDTLAIAAHEGWHQYTQQTFREPLPIWLEEGLATYMEGFVRHGSELPTFLPWANAERYETLRAAVRGQRLIPLDEILTKTPQSFLQQGKNRLLVYYAQVWALTHFLNEGAEGRYHDSLIALLHDAAAGRVSDRLAEELDGSSGAVRRTPRSTGAIMAMVYLNVDIAELGRQYEQFVDEAIQPGGLAEILHGSSPVVE